MPIILYIKLTEHYVRLCFESFTFLASKINNVLMCYTKSMISKLQKIYFLFKIDLKKYNEFSLILTRRVHTIQETDFRGNWRVNFWYLKMKPSMPNSVSYALFLEI